MANTVAKEGRDSLPPGITFSHTLYLFVEGCGEWVADSLFGVSLVE